MKFTRLRLVGFKSFVDSSEIVIEPGLTGIVGPNGCGKSNLVESLRWVMGESSHKSLRASGMDDVIFSGSGNRPGRNSAEVSLTIDNSSRRAPAQFNDSDVIEISRRIEREAGSVYRINGRDVRARDVQTLFADASTGAQSPALVRQGQIGELIAAKPKDRRRILEEAAGIAGLHSRRHEAELRLRAAEQNIERLDDVIAQLAAQLEGLKRQARQAARYRSISAEIRKFEAILWHLRHEAALAAIGEREVLVKEALATVSRLSEAAARAATEQADAAAALPGLRTGESEAAARLRHLVLARETLDREKEQAVARGRELAQRIEQITRDLERERATIAATSQTLERLRAEEAELKSLSAQAAGAEEELKRQVKAAGLELQEREAAMGDATAMAAELTARRRQFERIIREESQRLTKLAGQLAEIEAETARLGTGEAAGRAEALAAQVEQARTAAESAEIEAAELDQALAEAREAQDAARRPLVDAERNLKALETERATLAKVLAVEEGALWPSLIDAVAVEPGLEAALGAALGDDLDHPADEGAPIHWRAIAPMPGDPVLPSGVRPLADLVKAPEVLARRLAQTGLVEAARGAALQSLLHPGQRLVSREGDLWRWDGYTAVADAPTAAARRLSQRNRLEELTREIADAEALRARLQERADSAEAAARAAGAEASAAREAARRAQSELSAANDRRSAAEREASRDTSRLGALAEARLRLEASSEESRLAVRSANTGLEGLEGEAGPAGEVERLKDEVADARTRFAEARAALDGHAREAASRADRLARIAADEQSWADRLRDAEAQIATLQNRQNEIRAEAQKLISLPARLDEKRTRLAEDIERAETARKQAGDALAEAETRLAAADRAVRDAEAALSSAREAKAREEATLDGLRQRLADLEDTIEEALGRPAAGALAAAGLGSDAVLPDPEKLESDLERLKRDRERLGSVNLRAEEEMREVEARHDELAAERQDLEAAIQRLRTAIHGLNREGRERLLKAFDTVNGHFQHLFERLFGGGSAELKLTESDDPLEAGLEIFARPPGKRPQVLTLLSGGEQALTATALIFAVFLTNPAPICVLDEVDAPLDDANVERFCNLMDEMARTTETRFLLITHNPITMSRVDRLFGVTMAERGVSQLVSVDIGGALELREAG